MPGGRLGVPVSLSDRVQMLMQGGERFVPVPGGMVSESFAKDALLAWFLGEFTAANAIIDELMIHIGELPGFDGKNYEAASVAIHRRRMNWVAVIRDRQFFPITEVARELRKVARKVREDGKVTEEMNGGGDEVANRGSCKCKESHESDEMPETAAGSKAVQQMLQSSSQDDCEASAMNLTKGFTAKEPPKLHMVNIVAKGLKVYDNIFTDTQLSKLTDYVNELRVAGQNGELSGATFIRYDQATQQVSGGNKRELIQLGAPIFGDHVIKEAARNQFLEIEPIPDTLQGVIDHLVQGHLIPEHKKPNGCLINYFDEGEFSDPFMKPDQLEHPISTLFLSESEMAFGDTLVSDDDGKYKGSLMLTLKEGSLLVMRGEKGNVARHVMCSSQNKRITITFFRVRMDAQKTPSPIPPMTSDAMTPLQPGDPTDAAANGAGSSGKDALDLVPKLSVSGTPMVMVPQVPQTVLSPKSLSPGGTGVFLPCSANNSRGHNKNRARRRAQKGRKDGF
nr:PREDICTED: uncharacterized protein LOC108207422 [Daucus carota subsp. sativus]